MRRPNTVFSRKESVGKKEWIHHLGTHHTGRWIVLQNNWLINSTNFFICLKNVSHATEKKRWVMRWLCAWWDWLKIKICQKHQYYGCLHCPNRLFCGCCLRFHDFNLWRFFCLNLMTMHAKRKYNALTEGIRIIKTFAEYKCYH